MDENGQPIVTSTPTPQFDAAAFEKQSQAKAEEIANQKVQQLKDELASSLSGKQARTAPKSWDELHDNIAGDVTEKTTKLVDELVNKRFADEKKERDQKQEMTVKQQEATQKAEWAQMSTEWAEAVADGVIPDIAPEVKKKLKSNVAFSELTQEEQNDPGLKAYNEGRLLHAKLKSEGKSSSFYRTLDKFYNKQPAGMFAPVLGGSTPSSPQGQEYSYDEVVANRKARFGF